MACVTLFGGTFGKPSNHSRPTHEALRWYLTPARRRSTFIPFTALIGVLAALNAVMFLFPMAHRM